MGFLNNLLDSMGLNDFDDDYDLEDEEYDEAPRSSGGLFGRKKKEEDDYEEESFSKTYSTKSSPSPQQNVSSSKTTAFKSRSSSGSSYQNVPRSNTKLVPISNSASNDIFIIKPVDDTECWTVIDYLKEGKSVILNLDGMDITKAQHIIDIIVGSCYTLEGSIKQISACVFVAGPSSVDISGDFYQQVVSGSGSFIDLAKR